MKNNAKNSVILAGASGLVGNEILQLLAKDAWFKEVRILTRRPLSRVPQNLPARELVCDFDRLQEHPDWFAVDIVFSSLGTTISKAGSQAAFRRVDFDYSLALAKLARIAGARHFLFVSALGANSRSPFFYNRVKGELEEAVIGLGFPSLTIARPSLLLGDRREKRFGEEAVKKISWILPGKWAGVQAWQVAQALVNAAHQDRRGVRIIENRELRRTA